MWSLSLLSRRRKQETHLYLPPSSRVLAPQAEASQNDGLMIQLEQETLLDFLLGFGCFLSTTGGSLYQGLIYSSTRDYLQRWRNRQPVQQQLTLKNLPVPWWQAAVLHVRSD